MEGSEKDFARSGWRASHRRRGRGRGQNSVSKANIADASLGNNESRYDENSDAEDPEQVVRQSKGADLAELLEQATAQGDESLFRYRAVLDEEADDMLPHLSTSDPQQVLAVNFAAVADSLAGLPLHQLLGCSSELFVCKAVQPMVSRSSSSSQPASQKAELQCTAAAGMNKSAAIGSDAVARDLGAASEVTKLQTMDDSCTAGDTPVASSIQRTTLADEEGDLDFLLGSPGFASSSRPLAPTAKGVYCRQEGSVQNGVSGILASASLPATQGDEEGLDLLLSGLAVASSSERLLDKAAVSPIAPGVPSPVVNGNEQLVTRSTNDALVQEDADLDDLLGASSISSGSNMQQAPSAIERAAGGSRLSKGSKGNAEQHRLHNAKQEKDAIREQATTYEVSGEATDSLESWLANL